jgi:hypothetical protein
MLLRILFTIIAAVTFLFLFWRKLREDYTANQIFNTGFYSLFGLFAFSIFAQYYFFSFTYWISLVGSLIGLVAGINRFKFRTFESIEAWVAGSLGIMFWFYVHETVRKFNLFDSYAALVLAFLLFLFLYLDKHYKRFGWYKSGRVGFAGMAIMGTYFLIRCAVAMTFPNMLFFVGKTDALLSGILAFFSFVTVYNLSKIEIK